MSVVNKRKLIEEQLGDYRAPDEEFYKEQNDIDRFVNETKTRKMFTDMYEPLVENLATI